MTLHHRRPGLAPQPAADLDRGTTPDPFSRVSPIFTSSLTLADVLAALPDASNITLPQQQEMASAINTLTRLLGEAPSQIPANRRALSRRLDSVAPMAHGISKPSWSNLRSRLNVALDLVLPPHLRRRRNLLLAPEWQDLQERIVDQWVRKNLSRFFHCCSEAGISPAEVDEGMLTRFAGYLEIVQLKSPASIQRETRRAWNQACETVPDWPGMPLPGKPRADAYALPWITFPASLHADLQAWLDRLASGEAEVDLDGDLVDGPSRTLRPATLYHREYQIRQFASALVKQGVDPSTLHRLADLVNLPTLRLGLKFYRERHNGKYPPSLPGLLDALRSVARYWVKAPAADLRQMQLLLKAIRKKAPRYEEMTAKNLTRLHPILDDEVAAVTLLRLPKRLLQLAEEAQKPHHAFLLMQRALAIEILLKLPLRISNLAELDIKRNLSLPRDPAGVCRIILTADEVKNDNPINSPLPKFTCALLRRYLSEFRPAHTEPSSTALFPGHLGKAKNSQAFGRQVSKVVFDYTGLTMHPHLFRHAMISLYLKLRPGDKETARLVLGHKTITTVNKSYAFNDRDAAVRRFWQVLEEYLNKAAP